MEEKEEPGKQLDARRIEVSEMVNGEWITVYSQLTKKQTLNLICDVNGIKLSTASPSASEKTQKQ